MQYSARAIRALGHPMSLIAVGLLLINDHVLKQVVGNVITGKLSGIARGGRVLIAIAVHVLLVRKLGPEDRADLDALGEGASAS